MEEIKIECLKGQLNIELLTPIQWQGIMNAMQEFAKEYHKQQLKLCGVGVTLPTIEKAEELWDEGAELIGTDIDSLDWVAGTMRMDRASFIKACEKLKGN